MGDYRAGLVVELGILQPAFPTSSLPQPVMLDAVTSRVVGCQGVLLQDGAAPAQTYLIHRGPAWMLPLASRRADATVGNEKGSVEEVIAGSPQPRGQYGLLAVERDERVYGTIQCPRPAPKGARIDDAGWIGSALDHMRSHRTDGGSSRSGLHRWRWASQRRAAWSTSAGTAPASPHSRRP